MKKKSLILTLAALALVITSSIGTTYAYFTTYESAKGGYKLSMADYEEIKEVVTEDSKTIAIVSREDTEYDVWVRFRAIAPANIAETFVFTNTDGWTKNGDFWYYNTPLKPGETTSDIKVTYQGIKDTLVDMNKNGYKDDVEVVVIYECTAVSYSYDENGNETANPADWKRLFISSDPDADINKGGND